MRRAERLPWRKPVVRLTANFERNLADIERFPTGAEAPQADDTLLDELLDTGISNLERFPGIGRPFLAHAARSVETTNALEALRAKLSALTPDPDALREYILGHYLVLYAQIDASPYLLAIRIRRQLSFDFQSRWGGTSSMPQCDRTLSGSGRIFRFSAGRGIGRQCGGPKTQ